MDDEDRKFVLKIVITITIGVVVIFALMAGCSVLTDTGPRPV